MAWRNIYSRYKELLHVCYACGSTITTVNSKGKANWLLNLDIDMNSIGMLCHSCYEKYIRYPSRKSDINRRFFRYGSSIQRLGYKRELTGYCSKCTNNLFDRTCRTTHMHHWVYIIIFPWFGREELCASCHAKETWQNWQCMKLRVRMWDILDGFRLALQFYY
jgi:hypothetical protein